MRKQKRKIPTAQAVKIIIGKLTEWKAKGYAPGPILDLATENSWTTIYEPKAPPSASAGSGGSFLDYKLSKASR